MIKRLVRPAVNRDRWCSTPCFTSLNNHPDGAAETCSPAAILPGVEPHLEGSPASGSQVQVQFWAGGWRAAVPSCAGTLRNAPAHGLSRGSAGGTQRTADCRISDTHEDSKHACSAAWSPSRHATKSSFSSRLSSTRTSNWSRLYRVLQ